MTFDVAVIGATSQTGREILSILADAGLKKEHVAAVASSDRSMGAEISFGEDAELRVKGLEQFDLSMARVAIFTVQPPVAAIHAQRAARAGAMVIDGSGHFSLEPGVPLLRPSMEKKDMVAQAKKRIIAAPSALVDLAASVLAPLNVQTPIRRVVAASYQSASGAGKEAMDELFAQTRAVYVNDPIRSEVFTKQIAFNVIPHVDVFQGDGTTIEEARFESELKKLISPDMAVHATCVRVPVFIGNALALTVEFSGAMNDQAARAILKNIADVTLFDHRVNEGYVTPAECVGEDKVFVSRLRRDASVESGLSLWAVGDNIRRPAQNMADAAMKLLDRSLTTATEGTRH